jgi:hypothetical protein
VSYLVCPGQTLTSAPETVLDILTVIDYTALKKVAVIWNFAVSARFQTDERKE